MGTILKIAGFVLFPSIGGTAGGFITRKKIKTWFADLDKPAWRPPNWAFGPVWTTLYSGTNRREKGCFLTCGAAFSGLIRSVRLFSDGLRLLFNMARRWRLQWRGCSPSHALRDSTGYELDVDATLLRLRTDGIGVSMASSSRYYRYFNAVLA